VEGPLDAVYEHLATRAQDERSHRRVPLTGKFFELLLTHGVTGLAAAIHVSDRTLRRLLKNDGVTPLPEGAQ